MTEQLNPMPLDWRRGLAIVAHPDDLEYGASGAVAEWVEGGREIAYVLVTRGEAGIDSLPPEESARVREAEQLAGAAAVGVRTVEFLDHADGVIEAGPALRADLAAAVRRHRPELLITLNHRDTWGGHAWNTPDHRIVGRAALDAAGDAGNRWIFPEQLGEGGLEPWDGVRWVAVAASPRSTHAQALGDAALERGVASLVEHRAYVTGLGETDPEGYARSLLIDGAERESGRFGGRRCTPFELFPR
ncbi:PIG-L family deacetylase [Streptomyces sedi]